MAKQSNPTASSVLDALNSEEEISSEDNESEYDNTSDCEVTEERTDQEIEQGGTDSEQGPSSSSSIPSLLSVLRAPRLSDLTRKRKTQTNPGKPRKKTRPTSSAASEPKGVKPQDLICSIRKSVFVTKSFFQSPAAEFIARLYRNIIDVAIQWPLNMLS